MMIINLSLVGSGRHVSLRVASAEEEGVDLGAVGKLLAVDPATVRLNGHFLSRGPRHVSSLNWGSLLSFFSARGLPVGASDRDPIAVHGIPASSPQDLEDEDHFSFKRKIRLEDEPPTKKIRVPLDNSYKQRVDDNGVDEDSVCIGTRLKLDDFHPSKKPKNSHCKPSLSTEASKPLIGPSKIGFSYGCITCLGKRLREEENVVPIPCKRIK